MEESHARCDSSINSCHLKVSGDLGVTKQHLDQVKSLCDTQNLMTKRLQEKLGEENEFDPDNLSPNSERTMTNRPKTLRG